MDSIENSNGGPKTETGKRRSSNNALKHGLRSKKILLPGESRKEFERLLESIRQKNEETGLGRVLADQVGIATWRMWRLYKLEHNQLNASFGLHDHRMEDIFKYADVIDRAFSKSVRLLMEFRQRNQ